MLSHSILLGNNRSELQFVGDLANLCKRHKVSCGDPQDLTHLSADLDNDNFRTDLFALCTAISHMAEVDLSAEQLLALRRPRSRRSCSLRTGCRSRSPTGGDLRLSHRI